MRLWASGCPHSMAVSGFQYFPSASALCSGRYIYQYNGGYSVFLYQPEIYLICRGETEADRLSLLRQDRIGYW